MTQTNFRRGLDQEFVEKLNELYDQSDSWWRALVDDDKLFLAVRDNYINVYYLGCSLLKLTWKPKTGDVVGKTHYKFLLQPQLNLYVTIIDSKPPSLPPVEDMFTKNMADINALKKAAKPYAGDEKTGVHNIVLENWNVVDLEIAFAASSRDEEDKSAPRIDFAALKKTGPGFEIVFFEAKDFSNSDLRASGDADPKVIGQIDKYSGLLRDNCDAVTDSYRLVCGNLFDLRGLAKRHHERHEILKGIADGSTPLTVNDAPRLVVFGFDEAQRVGKDWKHHLDKLKDKLGEDRVLLRGNSKGFTRGIST